MNTNPITALLGPVTDREYLERIGVAKKAAQGVGAEEIKAAIARAGTSQAAIAAYLGVTTGVVGKVVNKMSRSARVERELEKITGRPIFDAPAQRGRKRAVWNGGVAA